MIVRFIFARNLRAFSLGLGIAAVVNALVGQWKVAVIEALLVVLALFISWRLKRV